MAGRRGKAWCAGLGGAILAWGALAAGGATCGAEQGPDGGAAEPEPEPHPFEGGEILSCDDADELADDPYDLQGASYVGGDELEIEVHYGGGCEEHEWALCWDGEFMESEPVQARLDLRHDDRDDPCRAYLHDTLTFDLAELREAYEEAYGAGPGTMILQLDGDGESVEYSW